MSDRPTSIQPAEVPLSHRPIKEPTDPGSNPSTAHNGGGPRWQRGALLALLVAAVAFLFFKPAPSDSTKSASSGTATPAAQAKASAGTGPKRADDQPPPFAAAQAELARKAAQQALAAFVERQIELKETLDVDAWGKDAFDEAVARATEGDELFVDEAFAAAQAAYEDAAEQLAQLVERSADRVAYLVGRGNEALANKRADDALQSFTQALAMASDSNDAKAGLARANVLPEVIALERKALNFSLADQWEQALDTYEAVKALDPETSGLAEAIAQAETAVLDQQIRAELSAGFDALEKRRLSAARSAFNTVLKLDPGNDVALGGLRDVDAASTIGRLATLERRAADAVQREAWDEALEHYAAALRIDPNIAFAKAGKPAAETQQRIASILQRIIDNPQKLSSDDLLADGRRQLQRAQQLTAQGPKLSAQVQQVEQLLKLYANPVSVTLTSDNRTDVLLSKLGKLGRFRDLEVSLRPGEYTALGSRDGCRDVRQTFVVRPDMGPIDIRCQDEL
ncbi:MAG: hypothetical protein AAF648_02915 [Pseudomonadota bacterium]